MKRQTLLAVAIGLCASILCASVVSRAADPKPGVKADTQEDKPIRALLVLGGCCHDYKKQKDILTRGISERANVEWTIAYDPDTSTKHLNPVYDKDDWYKGFDVVVHDECSADVTDMAAIERILKPHKEGLPGVVLHCAMHCYRTKGWDDKKAPPTPWFEFTGLPSKGHGQQKPIEVTYVDKESPITKGFENWTTIQEELYNNYRGGPLDTAHALARGKQGNEDVVVVWTNTYNNKTKVFGTTLGHNNETVSDPKYLDLITRGLLWSVGKLDEQHLKPAKKVFMDGAEPKDDKKAGANADPNRLVPIDLARGKTAIASSVQEGHDPKDALDGDGESRWCANGDSAPQWLQVDLGKSQDLAGVRLTWEKDGAAYQYKVEGSADGKAWTTLADETKSNLAEQVREHRFDGCCGNAPVKGADNVRFVKVTVTGLSPGCWASLYELAVLGKQMVPASSQQAAKSASSSSTDRLLAGMKPPPGYELTMFAAPPEVNYPTCLTASPSGELFIGVDPDGSLGREVGRGKVLRLVDSTGSGKADRINEFAKMDHPRGVVWDAAARRLYVLHPPFFSVYTDEDGDGVAEKSEDLITGISVAKTVGARGADHTTNGIRLGIDGWIYIAMGDFGCRAKAKDGTELTVHGGGILRVRPDGSGLEVYCHHTRNIYDVAIDPFLNVFTRDNTNDGDGWNDRLAYDIPTGNYGYPSLFKHFPGEFVDCLNDYSGGSPCGSLFTDEPNLPGELGHALLTVEWGRSAIFRHPLTPQGAGYKAPTPEVKVMDLPRGTDLDVDAAGRFYASSWANGGFSYSGPNVGFVVRLAPTGTKPAPFPDMAKATPDHLLGYLASPSGVARVAAQREILHRGDRAAFSAGLQKLIASSQALPQARVAAMFTLKLLLGNPADATLVDAARDGTIRESALRALIDDRKDNAVPTGPLVEALKDANPRVRLVAAWGIGRLNKAEAAAALVPLAADSDFLVAHVAINSLVALKADGPCLNAVQSSSSQELVRGVLLALQQMHDPAVVEALVGKLRTIQEPDARGAIYRALCRLYYTEAEWDGSWWGTRPDTSGPYFKTADWSGTPEVRQAILAALNTEKGEVLRGLLIDAQKNKVSLPEVSQAVAKLAAADPAFRAQTIDLLGTKNALGPEDVALLKGVVSSDRESAVLRAKSLRVLARGNGASRDVAVDAIVPLLGAQKLDPELTAAVDEFIRDTRHAQQMGYFARLTASEDPARRELGYAVLLNLASSRLGKADTRAAAAKAVEKGWDQPTTAAPLLLAVGRLKADAYKDRVQALAADKNPDVARAAAFAADRLGLKGAGGAVAGHDPRDLIESVGYDKTLAAVLKEKGDPKLGQELFTRQGCVACHTTSAAEPPKGPLLAGIAARYSRAELCESILKPSAKISQGFETQWFKTNDGDQQEGFVTRESGDEIELRNGAGIAMVLKKSDIKSRGKRDISIMPEGLVAKLTPRELASLVAYLESLKGK
jgi:putative heme-binding domain-containing protein